MTIFAPIEAVGNASSIPRLPFTERGALRLFVRAEPYPTRLGGSIATLLRFGGFHSASGATGSKYFFRHSLPARAGRPWPSVSGSLLLHCSVVALLVYISPRLLAANRLVPAPYSREIIYYRIPLRDAAKIPQLSRLSAQRRGMPDSASAPAADPPDSSVARARATVAALFSQPAHPDNSRQTILQSAAPPELKIKTEQPLPNVVALSAPEKPKFPLALQYSRPNAVDHSNAEITSPTISDTNSREPLRVIANSTDNFLPAPSSPISRGPRSGPEADAADLVVVGLDPSDPAADLALPPGNRWGDFAVGPPAPGSNPNAGSGARPGTGSGAGSASPNGASKGDGSGAGGNGANRGTGGRNGESDRGDAGISGPVTIGGSGNGGIANGALEQLAPDMIYPVVQSLNGIRRNTMVISAGPIGGGGLRIYGALSCGSIYSIFLPMPGKNWSLQYCEASAGTAKAERDTHASSIHLEKPLLPPDVDLDHRFDFKRTPVQGPKANHLIVLKGVIATDGTVQNLEIYQGVSAELDKAARTAFERWHFRPAMRDGKAVAVEILVGIPPVTD